jgi:uncharacterized protein YjiS (DUF1127 family)
MIHFVLILYDKKLNCVNTILEDEMSQSQTVTSARLAYLDERPRLPVLAHIAVTVAVIAAHWSTRSRTRKSLSELDPHLLRDVNLTEYEAKRESNKWFWQV